ncbi:MAG TPA: DUF6090 family protein [Yeosuana sp.]
MIKVFNSIRQKLISQNKLSKYLVYAIGEIILVVIGILIALQVNNWNEELKTRKEEQNTLVKLFRESDEIVNYLNDVCNRYDTLILKINKSANALNNKALNEMSEEDFAFGVYSTAYFESISPPKSTFEELNSTGKINAIQSESVRISISNYYSKLEYINTQLVYFRNQFTKPVDYGSKDFVYKYDKRSNEKIKALVNFNNLANNDLFISKHVKALRDQIVFNEDRKVLLGFAKSMYQELKTEVGKNND